MVASRLGDVLVHVWPGLSVNLNPVAIQRGDGSAAESHESPARRARRVLALARWGHLPLVTCIDLPTRRTREPLERPARLPSSTVVESDNCPSVSLDVLKRYQQVIFTKDHADPLTNPKLDRMLTELPAERFVLFGGPLESSLRMLALGLLRRARSVAILLDACGVAGGAAECDMTLRRLDVKGCTMLPSDVWIAEQLARARGPQPRPARTLVRRRSVA